VSAIYILSLGRADRTLAEGLCKVLGRTFGRDVQIREVVHSIEPFYDQQRVQYNSTAIISSLQVHLPFAAGMQDGRSVPSPKLLGVVAEDLFIPVLTYVFGEAQLGGPVAVVSYHRLQNERYGLPPDDNLLRARLEKEAIHELGHTFGLVHCPSQDCAMHASTYVEDIDFKSASLCPSCAAAVRKQS
jgi:archaemetzincin